MTQSMTISEPTQREFDSANPGESKFAHIFADAPESAPAPAPEPDRNAPPTWGLPRINASMDWADSTAHLGVVPKEGHLKLTLTAETVASGTHVLADRRRSLTETTYAESHARVLSSEEYTRAAGIVPLHAAAERRLRAALAKLDTLAARKAKLVASPKPDLGKKLVELEAEAVALTKEVAEHRAELQALAAPASDARAALLQAARQHCRDVKNASREAGTKRLAQVVAAFFASHPDELTEIATASSVRSADGPADAVALVKMLEADLVAAPEGE